MARILLFGGFVQSLSAAASLKAAGHEVVIVAQNDPVAKRCRSKEKYIEIKIEAPEAVVLKQLIHIVQSEKIDVAIPLEDAYAVILSKYRRQIADSTGVLCAVPDWHPFSLAWGIPRRESSMTTIMNWLHPWAFRRLSSLTTRKARREFYW